MPAGGGGGGVVRDAAEEAEIIPQHGSEIVASTGVFAMAQLVPSQGRPHLSRLRTHEINTDHIPLIQDCRKDHEERKRWIRVIGHAGRLHTKLMFKLSKKKM